MKRSPLLLGVLLLVSLLAACGGGAGVQVIFLQRGGSQRGEKEVEWARPRVWLARQEQACARPPRWSNGSSF